MANKRYHLILMFICLLSNSCGPVGRLTIRGTVLNEAGMPISGVGVFLVFMRSSKTNTRVDATTKDDGAYLIDRYYGHYSNSYIVFKKSGYQDTDTKSNPLGELDARKFRDVIITRDAVMKVAP